MHKFRITFLLALVAALFTLPACNKDDSNARTAPFQLRLTDSPGNYDEVNIDVLSARVHIDGGIGWVSLATNAGIYDLLQLTNGTDTLIANADLPYGTISQVRLLLGPNSTIKVNGVVHPLATPSAQQSGLKINVHQELLQNITYTILLDFDVAQSIVEHGNGTYSLKPVIRAIANPLDGGIEGTVVPAASSPVVYAINGPDSVSAIADATGYFFIHHLQSGSYNVWFAPDSAYNDTLVSGVSVTTGTITNMGIIPISQ